MSKRFLILGIFSILMVFSNCSRMLLKQPQCFKLIKLNNGQLYTVSISSSQWWSTTTINVKIKNDCSTPQIMKDLALIVQDWRVNGKIVTGEVSVNQSGSPWLTIVTTYSANLIRVGLSTPACEGSFCDWAKISSGGVYNLSIMYSVGQPIQTSTVQKVYIGGGTPSPTTGAKLDLTVTNFPGDFTKPVEAVLTDTTTQEMFKGTLSNTVTTLTLDQGIAGHSYQVYIPGIGFPSQGVYYSPINTTSKPLVSGQSVELNVSYTQNNSLHNVKFTSSGFTGSGQAQLDFTSQNYVYNNEALNPSIAKVFSFPLQENATAIIKPPSGWSATINPSLISPSVSQVQATFSNADPLRQQQLNIGGYYQTWSANWAGEGSKLSIANIPSWITFILVAFADPNLSYHAGQNSFAGTGLSFSSSFNVVKDAISVAHSKNTNQKFLLSVGGATYLWANPNFQGMVDLMNDLGLDGLDIDLEESTSCSGLNTINLSCTTDNKITNIITTLRGKITGGKLLTAAVFSVGAYGTARFPNTQYPPVSNYDGLWVNPLKNAGNNLDVIFIMSYDAGPSFSPTDAFNAYRDIYNGKILIGLEVPPEAWGGYELTLEDALKYARYSRDNGGSGVFIWSLEKQTGNLNSNYYLIPICKLYNLQNCDQRIPLN